MNVIQGAQLGSFSASGTATDSVAHAAGEHHFYRFNLFDGVYAAYGDTLTLDTDGSSLPTDDDTELSLFDAEGNLVAQDDDGGTGFLSLLSFGAGGLDGDLAAVVYYLASAAFSANFFDGFNVSSSSTTTGTIAVNLDLDEAGTTLTGDYNGDGTVDAADYTVWRDDQGTSLGGNTGYTDWVNNFGNSLPAIAIPEPGTMLLAAMGLLCAGCRGRYRRLG